MGACSACIDSPDSTLWIMWLGIGKEPNLERGCEMIVLAVDDARMGAITAKA